MTTAGNGLKLRLDFARVHRCLAHACEASATGYARSSGLSQLRGQSAAEATRAARNQGLPSDATSSCGAAAGCESWHDEKSASHDYGLSFLPEHLAQAKEEERLEQILSVFDFAMQAMPVRSARSDF